jgi:UDP-N-acetylglucosamine:LPS N-acetylglucosamine transferase
VTGEDGYATALQHRRLPAEIRDRYRPLPFLRDEMADALVAADLILGRAGSSTLAGGDDARRLILVLPARGRPSARQRRRIGGGRCGHRHR